MVDKPHGKTEVLLDGIFEFFKSKSEFVKDKTSTAELPVFNETVSLKDSK